CVKREAYYKSPYAMDYW
nr:immunoglobulin heavy chain junction region [Mus musculus]